MKLLLKIIMVFQLLNPLLTVTSVNDPVGLDFTFGDSGLSIDEDSGDHIINLTPDDPDVVTNYQTLSYSVESDKPDLVQAYIENISLLG